MFYQPNGFEWEHWLHKYFEMQNIFLKLSFSKFQNVKYKSIFDLFWPLADFPSCSSFIKLSPLRPQNAVLKHNSHNYKCTDFI